MKNSKRAILFVDAVENNLIEKAFSTSIVDCINYLKNHEEIEIIYIESENISVSDITKILKLNKKIVFLKNNIDKVIF